MKYKIRLCIFLFVFFSVCAFSQSKKGYRLVWQDNFSGKELDTTTWTNETANPRWVNNEWQRYTNGGNVKVSKGKLKIEARYKNGEYTSGRINTRSKKTFIYGIIEMKAKLPKGTGTWPALWMLGQNDQAVGWPACGELDIMEHVGKHPGFIHTSIHNSSGYGQTPYTGILQVKDPFNTYHIYGMEWTKDLISFYVDHKLSYCYRPDIKNKDNWPFDKPFFLIFNIAVGGDWGGPVVDNNCFPAVMLVDWVKVYQKK
ncbi:MAG: glycoside hydrolase family 16 protein [Bacteroidota bacterium]|nr:glycoside hydrolase family 16 protein [Bacteroidota bacterium]